MAKCSQSLDKVITIFLASWGRPIYLWTCLDALSRYTRLPFQVVLLNNAHPDRLQSNLVEEVISSFSARNMFAEIVMFNDNSFDNIERAYKSRLSDVGANHIFMESDAVICERNDCWLETMQRIMINNPSIGMLGSMIDARDFVSKETALSLVNNNQETANFLAKLQSPERGFINSSELTDSLADFFVTEHPFPIKTPPGRLLMLHTETMMSLGLHADVTLAQKFRQLGMTPAITPLVKHRHLSLLNIYDYKDYSAESRNRFFSG